ncbi:anaphase-promoting complex subunit 2 [Corchorus olitorius]|uniref:Anaphase-promoting complex subunit 2 n=1 Tax=Corchorus olitorius TaxID=93759 RepID=A0A1R3I5Q1_9ROSI|nr:anaphase-promoting complex subunit 2 [Corchorus olitorius]
MPINTNLKTENLKTLKTDFLLPSLSKLPEILFYGGAAAPESPETSDGSQTPLKCSPSPSEHSADNGKKEKKDTRVLEERKRENEEKPRVLRQPAAVDPTVII